MKKPKQSLQLSCMENWIQLVLLGLLSDESDVNPVPFAMVISHCGPPDPRLHPDHVTSFQVAAPPLMQQQQQP